MMVYVEAGKYQRESILEFRNFVSEDLQRR